MDLVCPAGSLPALKAAVDHGADAVYLGFRNATNARNFPGLNFDVDEIQQGLTYARSRNVRVLLALNTFPQPTHWQQGTRAVDEAAELGVDALIMADPGLMRYTACRHPDLRLHLSVQGSATNRHSIQFYHDEFGIKQVVLPRVLSLSQVRQVIQATPVEVEVFGVPAP